MSPSAQQIHSYIFWSGMNRKTNGIWQSIKRTQNREDFHDNQYLKDDEPWQDN